MLDVKWNLRAFAARLGLLLIVAVIAPRAAWGLTSPIQPAHVLKGHRDSVTAVAFLPDGKRAISASADHTLKIWDLASGQLLRTIDAHQKAVNAVAVSADGKQVASGGDDNLVRVWDPDTGRQLAQLEGHTRGVMAVRFVKGGRLVSVGHDAVRLWDVARENQIWHLRAADWPIDAADITPDGTRVGFVKDDGITQVWDVDVQKQLREYGQTRIIPQHILLSPDGRELICMTAGGQGRYERRDLATDKVLQLPVELGNASAIAFSPDGHHLLVAGFGVADMYDYPSFDRERGINSDATEPIHAMAISADGRTALIGTGGEPGRAGAWMPGRVNTIAVATLTGTDVATARPAAGSVSWDVIHAMVHTRDGELRPLVAMDWQAKVLMVQDGAWSWPFRRAFDDADVVVSPASIFLHREGGTLEETLTDRDAGFADAIPDGRYLWVTSSAKGIWLLDHTGKLLGHCGLAEGLPESTRPSKVCVLGEGRLLAIGSRIVSQPKPRAEGWVAVLEYKPGDAKINLRILGSAYALPKGWPQSDADRFDPSELVSPLARPNATGGEALVLFRPTARRTQLILHVNARTLTTSVEETQPQPAPMRRPPTSAGSPNGSVARPTTRPRPVVHPSPQPAVWMPPRHSDYPLGELVTAKDGSVLAWYGASVQRFVPTQNGWDFKGEVGRFGWPSGPLLLTDGVYYVPGAMWYRIDPVTLEPTRLGPGIKPVAKFGLAHVSYALSASLGLAAFSPDDALFYRFSVDPKNPLPRHPIEEPSNGAIMRIGSPDGAR